MTKPHWPNRNPTLERKDLEIILDLLDQLVENPEIKNLKNKIEDSLSVYHNEDRLIEEAKRKIEQRKAESLKLKIKNMFQT